VTETYAPLEIWQAFLQAHAAVVSALEDQLQAEYGLPVTSFEVLLRLAEAPGSSLRMQDLTEGLVLSKSGVTRLVDRLERAGLVERRSCPSDRRGTFAVLTEEGRRTLRRVRPTAVRFVESNFWCHVDEADAAAFAGVLRRLLEAHGRKPGRCLGG
jgi:DNA-binding MarR family transcriptional regulator